METLSQEITRTSSKGQIVIPTKMRKKLSIKKGSLFYITSKNGLIILKRLAAGISKADLKTLRNVEEAWKDIENGNYKIYSKDSFSKELAKW
jgi:AbrB family looped-hinge helix DNA binding protein